MYCRCTVRNIAGLVLPLQRTYSARWNLSFVSSGPTLLFSFPYVRRIRISFGHCLGNDKMFFRTLMKVETHNGDSFYTLPLQLQHGFELSRENRTASRDLNRKEFVIILLFRSVRLDDVFTSSFTNDNFSCNYTILLSLLTSVVERSAFSSLAVRSHRQRREKNTVSHEIDS